MPTEIPHTLADGRQLICEPYAPAQMEVRIEDPVTGEVLNEWQIGTGAPALNEQRHKPETPEQIIERIVRRTQK